MGFLETFVRYVEEFESDPARDAAGRVRDRATGGSRKDVRDAEVRAKDMERISGVLFGRETG